jgi:hypothetical protein
MRVTITGEEELAGAAGADPVVRRAGARTHIVQLMPTSKP